MTGTTGGQFQSQWEREKEIRRQSARRRKEQQRVEEVLVRQEQERRAEALRSRHEQKQRENSYLKKNVRGKTRAAPHGSDVPVTVVVAPNAARRGGGRKASRSDKPAGYVGYEMELSPSELDKSAAKHRLQALAKLGEQKVRT